MIVEVGLGEERFVSRNSVGGGPLGKAIVRTASVWAELPVVVDGRVCIVPPGLRCTGSSLTTALGETASERFADFLVR